MAFSPYLAFFLPAAVLYGTWFAWSRQHAGLAFAYATIGLIFIVVPLADLLAGARRRTGAAPERAARPASEMAIVMLSLPLQVTTIFFFGWYLAAHALSWPGMATLLLVAGIMSALYAQNPAHELIHHGSRFERLVGITLFSTSLYSGAKMAHVQSHHLLVATSADPTSARYGQSLYGYLPRAVAVNLFGWWGPRGTTAVRVRRFRRNIMLANMLGYAMSVGWAAALYGLYGIRAVVFFLLQSAIGILVLEMMNYIGHYGLERRSDAAGRMEPVSERHAWDCDLPFSNLVLISVQKHSDHHLNPDKSYGELRCTPGSPRLPLSYPLLFILTLLPFLWRRVIHPRLDAYRASAGMMPPDMGRT